MRIENNRPPPTEEDLENLRKKQDAVDAGIRQLKTDADSGNAYAEIELAKMCFQPYMPPWGGELPACKGVDSLVVLKNYSDRGYEIASFYYASFGLGLTYFGSHIAGCEKRVFGFRYPFCSTPERAALLMRQLTQKGCEYKVLTYKGPETIQPCSRLNFDKSQSESLFR